MPMQCEKTVDRVAQEKKRRQLDAYCSEQLRRGISLDTFEKIQTLTAAEVRKRYKDPTSAFDPWGWCCPEHIVKRILTDRDYLNSYHTICAKIEQNDCWWEFPRPSELPRSTDWTLLPEPAPEYGCGEDYFRAVIEKLGIDHNRITIADLNIDRIKGLPSQPVGKISWVSVEDADCYVESWQTAANKLLLAYTKKILEIRNY